MVVPARGHKGGAKPTSLSGSLSNSALSFTVTAGGGTGYPDGSTGAFVVCLDAGLAGEEKVLCASRSTDTFTITSRGYDDTAATAHANLATVSHVFSAIEAQEANDHLRATTGVHGITDTAALMTTAAANAAFAPIATIGLNGAATASVVTTESTTSTSFTDLATVLSVAATIGASGKALVILTADIASVTTVGAYAVAGFAVSGATTVPATDSRALSLQSNSTTSQRVMASAMFLVTGLTPGSNTFTQKYRVTAGTGVFDTRSILVIPA